MPRNKLIFGLGIKKGGGLNDTLQEEAIEDHY